MTTDPLVPVLDRRALGHPEHGDAAGPAAYGPLSAVLEDRYSWDAHFAAYSLPGVPHRLAGDGALELGPAVVLLVADVDCPRGEDPAAWWPAQRARARLLRLKRPGGLVYRTRGGFRLLYRLSEPLVLRERADRERWRASYLAWLATLEREHGIAGDRQCQDWTRLYRLPRVVRDGVPQDPEFLGDPRAVGTWPLPEVAPPERRSAFADIRPRIQRAPGEGSRNRELFRYACSLRRRGLGEGEILAVVRERNAALDEPLGDDEVEKLVGSSTKYEPDPALLEAQERSEGYDGPVLEVGDHVELARLELARLGPAARLAADRGDLHAYDPELGTWRALERPALRAAVAAYSGAIVQRRGLRADGEPFAPTNLKITDSTMRGVVSAMMDISARPGFFDDAPAGLAFADGFAAVLPGGVVELRDHAPENRAAHAHPWPFDPAPRTPLWDRFLADLLLSPDVVRFVHEYLGACLLGDVVRHKTCLALTGKGDNGKSVLLDVAQACFPRGAVAAVSPRDWGRRFVLHLLGGALVNVVDELPPLRFDDSSIFKEVVSGGRVRAERKYEGAYHFRPRCGHVFACNELPRTVDRSDGFFTRWAVVDLTRQFQEHEQDRSLRERLMGELPALSSRLVLAAADLVRRGRLELPAEARAAREAWQAAGDHALRFALSLEPDPGAAVEVRRLYEAFCRWADRDERVPPGEVPPLRSFAQALRRAGVEPADGAGRTWRAKFSPFAHLQ